MFMTIPYAEKLKKIIGAKCKNAQFKKGILKENFILWQKKRK